MEVVVMYQDSGGVEDGEYHIMYGSYDPLKLGPDPPSPTMKLTAVVQDDQGTMSANGSLATVTLSTGGTLVSPALANSALAVSSAALTSTSLGSHHLVASSQVQETTNPGSSVMAISTVADESGGLADADLDPLDVAALGSDQNRTTHVNIDQIVSTTDQTGLDGGQLVTSSSIDAVVTSVFAPDCAGMNGNGRKLPPQVVVKFFGEKFIGEDTLDLDVVRILPDPGVEGGSHGFNLLARNGTIVQKLSESEIITGVGDDHHQYRPDEVLGGPEERTDIEGEEAGQCNVVWTCAYCNLAFSSSEAVACHQEKDCSTKNPGLHETSTSQATVDALMSPLRPPDEPTYDFKLERASAQQTDDMTDEHISQESSVEEERELLTIWTCSVCGVEFPKSEVLNDHLLTHTIQELSSALLKLTVPCQIVKKRHKVRSRNTNNTSIDIPSDAGHRSASTTLASDSGQLKWSQEHSEVALTKMEEVFVMDTPGDTPPHTPPQETLMKRTKKKPGPKARPRDKNEKRKYVRKMGEAGQPTTRQREHCTPPIGQGSRDPHTCQICNKVLSSRGNLSKHMVLHKEKKPFVCNLCGAEFNAKRDKHHHYLQHHTKERPNVCHICGKGYVDSNYLHEHMVFHQQERSFSCDVCGKLFHTIRCVARHKKRHGKDRNFDCEQCFRSFGIKADLTSHQRKVHGNAKRAQQPGRQQQQQVIQHGGGQQQQQQIKTKELSEFVLTGSPPHIIGEEQLLQGELEPGCPKDNNIFLTDSLPVSAIIPITAAGGETCPYGVTLATTPATHGTGESGGTTQATYIMIEGTSGGGDVTNSHTLPPAPGLIMYTPVTTTSQQVVGEELEDPQEQLVVGVEGELQPSTLHPHHHHHHHRQTQGTGGLGEDDGPELALDAALSTTTTADIHRGDTHNNSVSHDGGGPHTPPQPSLWSYSPI
ncbi:hypothetical protein Pmani_015359 [Petrolisthes manimaculis]|uniref:C2H2-type domain-containing protein n=1 Tax=Petrolisthes manimaculis TaxID=1843537 RepID=A0AAE1U7Q9_9EUCA|nr:hypothetical protein Pmani_015359 [Petrolisthes manimaculis]